MVFVCVCRARQVRRNAVAEFPFFTFPSGDRWLIDEPTFPCSSCFLVYLGRLILRRSLLCSYSCNEFEVQRTNEDTILYAMHTLMKFSCSSIGQGEPSLSTIIHDDCDGVSCLRVIGSYLFCKFMNGGSVFYLEIAELEVCKYKIKIGCSIASHCTIFSFIYIFNS